jgi:cytochrome c553
MIKPTLLVVCASLGLLTACSNSGEETADRSTNEGAAPAETTLVTAELLSQGRDSWILWCANCHGMEGRGDGPDSVLLDPKPRDQTDRDYMDKLTDRELAETVVYGGAPRGYPNMPALPQVWGEELVALIAHVRNLSQPGIESVALTVDSPL